MRSRTDVIKGLECCRKNTDEDPFVGCVGCPYDTTISAQECRSVLASDALELIRKILEHIK